MLNQDKINQALQKLGITSLNDMQQAVLEAGTKKGSGFAQSDRIG